MAFGIGDVPGPRPDPSCRYRWRAAVRLASASEEDLGDRKPIHICRYRIGPVARPLIGVLVQVEPFVDNGGLAAITKAAIRRRELYVQKQAVSDSNATARLKRRELLADIESFNRAKSSAGKSSTDD